LTPDDVMVIKSLFKKQFHHLITPEIRKALGAQHTGQEELAGNLMVLN
jgi:hypothetical protein